MSDSDSRETLRSNALNRVSEAIIGLNSDLKCTFANSQAEQLLDASEKSLLGTNILRSSPEITDTLTGQELTDAIETSQEQMFERYNETLDRWFEVRVYPDRDGVSVFLTDISEHKERERELERYEQVIEALPVAVGVNSLGEAGQFEFVNQTAVEMFDAELKEELKEHSAGDLYADPDERMEFSDRLREERTVEQYETEFKTLDGKRLWVSITAKLTEIGGEKRIVGIIEDVSDRKQQEQELQEKQERLRGLFDEAPDPMFVQNEDGKFMDVNRKAAERLGYSREELLEMEAADLDAAVDQADARRLLSIAKSEGKTIEIEGRHQCADGSMYPVDVRVTPLEQDSKDRFLSHVRDITERKERERELERKQGFLEQTQEVASVGGWETDLRTDSLKWTTEVYRIYGVGSDFQPTVEGAIDLFHPEDQATVQNAVEKATTEGEPYDKEVRIVRPDGEVRWTRARGEPRYEDGETIGVRGTFQDITERKEREQKLERHRNVIQAVDDGVYALDETGHFELVNDAMSELTGYDTEELLGEHTSVIKSDETIEQAESVVRAMIFGEREDNEATLELEIQRTDGREFPAEDHITLLWGNDGERFEGTAGIVRNITERKKREQELQRQNSRLNEFVSVVSHDLRNPLGVAQGRATILQEQTDDEFQEHLAPLLNSVERMEDIIEDTLTLARQGEIVGEMSPIPFSELMGECWAGVETGEAALEIDAQFTIRGDRDRLRHVFENLFRNAVEHGREDVTVWVGRAGENGIYVEDDGPGIPPGDRSTVFEPGHTSVVGGTGFGLTIVKRIAEAHSWEVTVTDGRHGGARFEFDTTGVMNE